MNQYSNNIDKAKIIQAYTVENLSVTKIAKKLTHASKVISRILREAGLEIRSCSAYSDHKYVDDFFEKIDSEEKAYWLGFLYADGYISNLIGSKCISLELNAKDLTHLEKFKKAIAPDARITFCKKKRMFEDKEYCRLRVFNVKLVNQLISKGCYQAKSLILSFPSKDIIPTKLIHHFIRGYFDGDGCIKYNGCHTAMVTMVGTESFLNSLQDLFASKISDYTKTKLQKCGEVKCYSKGGNIAVKSLFAFMYKDATVWLDRKYQRFCQFWPRQEVISDCIIAEQIGNPEMGIRH